MEPHDDDSAIIILKRIDYNLYECIKSNNGAGPIEDEDEDEEEMMMMMTGQLLVRFYRQTLESRSPIPFGVEYDCKKGRYSYGIIMNILPWTFELHMCFFPAKKGSRWESVLAKYQEDPLDYPHQPQNDDFEAYRALCKEHQTKVLNAQRLWVREAYLFEALLGETRETYFKDFMIQRMKHERKVWLSNAELAPVLQPWFKKTLQTLIKRKEVKMNQTTKKLALGWAADEHERCVKLLKDAKLVHDLSVKPFVLEKNQVLRGEWKVDFLRACDPQIDAKQIPVTMIAPYCNEKYPFPLRDKIRKGLDGFDVPSESRCLHVSNTGERGYISKDVHQVRLLMKHGGGYNANDIVHVYPIPGDPSNYTVKKPGYEQVQIEKTWLWKYSKYAHAARFEDLIKVRTGDFDLIVLYEDDWTSPKWTREALRAVRNDPERLVIVEGYHQQKTNKNVSKVCSQ